MKFDDEEKFGELVQSCNWQHASSQNVDKERAPSEYAGDIVASRVNKDNSYTLSVYNQRGVFCKTLRKDDMKELADSLNLRNWAAFFDFIQTSLSSDSFDIAPADGSEDVLQMTFRFALVKTLSLSITVKLDRCRDAEQVAVLKDMLVIVHSAARETVRDVLALGEAQVQRSETSAAADVTALREELAAKQSEIDRLRNELDRTKGELADGSFGVVGEDSGLASQVLDAAALRARQAALHVPRKTNVRPDASLVNPTAPKRRKAGGARIRKAADDE